MPTQDEWEDKRRFVDRCPKCGSARTTFSDEWSDGTRCGVYCPDCDYDNNCGNPIPGFSDKPFIAPGEPGSHDTPEDYPDAGTD